MFSSNIVLLLKGGIGNQFYQISALDYIYNKYNIDSEIDISNFKFRQNPREINIDRLLTKFGENMPYKFTKRIYRLFYEYVPKLLNIDHYNSLLPFRKIVLDTSQIRYFLDKSYNSKLLLLGYFQTHEIASNSNLIRKLREREGKREFDGEIAIHLRLGDYLIPPYNKIYKIVSDEYLYSALEEVKKNVGNSSIKKLKIFSDSKKEAFEIIKKVKPKNTEIIISNERNAIDDLENLSSHCIKILSNSTFSLLSYYLKKASLTIIPKNWFIKTKTDFELFPPNHYNGKVLLLDN